MRTRRTVPPELLPPGLLLPGLLFFGAALLYASVGFGGGTAYLALLSLWGLPLHEVVVLALVCNVVVVAGGSWHFARAGHLELRLAVPILAASVPAAYLGGRIPVDDGPLATVMGGALLLAAVAMALETSRYGDAEVSPGAAAPGAGRRSRAGSGILGGVIGGVSGMVGIGGGVFLAPVLHLLRWATPKRIAATASVFILLNSLAGLAGKLGWMEHPGSLLPYAPLVVAVFLGGQIGSRLGARRLSPRLVRRVTAGVVAVAAVNLLVGG